MNETLKTISERYSCRSFNEKKPSDEDLNQIANAVIASPSGMNRQNWRVIIVKNRELIDEMESEGMNVLAAMPDQSTYKRIMSRTGTLYYNAPCMMIFPIEKAEPAGAELVDCGIVSQTAALAATSLGIDNVICGLAGLCFATEKADCFKKRLGFPDGFEFGCAILLGYADKVTAPHVPDTSKISIVL